MNPTLETTCCIVGGGPAGMMLGVLELDDGSVLEASSWEEGCQVLVDPAVPATRKGRPTKEPPLLLVSPR